MQKKKIIKLAVIMIALLLAVGIYRYIDCAYFPDLRLSQRSSKKDDRFEIVLMAEVPKSNIIPLAKSVEKNIQKFQNWTNSIIDEVSGVEYMLPIDVRSYGKVENGKTTVRYEGYVTTVEGERVEYCREHTFDFVIAPDKA